MLARPPQISYSSYDSALAPDAARGGLWRALRLIQRKHRRTEASPERAVYIGEFGVPTMSTNWDDTMEKVRTVMEAGRCICVTPPAPSECGDRHLCLTGGSVWYRRLYGQFKNAINVAAAANSAFFIFWQVRSSPVYLGNGASRLGESGDSQHQRAH